MKIDKTNKNIWVRKGTANFGKPKISAIGVEDLYWFGSNGQSVNITFNNRGGYATSWTISPNVNESNLTFDNNSGKIGGNTTTLTGTSVTYKVTAKNGYGTSSVNVTFTRKLLRPAK